MTTPPTEGRLAYKWKVLISVIFGIFMVILDTTVVNVAFRELQREFGASLGDAQWIISVYVLSLGITTPVAGFLADRFGIKRMYITGLALFVFGSVLCGLAPTSSIWYLVAARALQGIGGGILFPLGLPQIYAAFPPNEQGMALGFFGIALVVGPALGPILGGWLVDQSAWRWIFFINLPIGLLGITLASRFLRERKSDRSHSLDIPGLVTEIIGFGSVLYAASIAEREGWTDPTVLMWFGIGAVGLLAFVIVELYVAKEPLLDLRLFKKRIYLMASLVGYVSVVALFGAEFLMPVYLQALRGRTALQTGLILLPLAIAAAFATPTAGKLYDKIGPRILIVLGFGLLLLNTWQLSQIQADTSITWIMVLLALRGLALGMTVQTTFVTALSVVPQRELPRGSALTNSTRQVVQSIGVAVLATVLTSTLSPQTRDLQKRFEEQASQQQTAAAARFGVCETPGVPRDQNLPPGAAAAPAEVQTQIKASLALACQENVAGFERAYRFTFYFALLAMVLGAFLPGWPLKWAGRRAADMPEGAAAH